MVVRHFHFIFLAAIALAGFRPSGAPPVNVTAPPLRSEPAANGVDANELPKPPLLQANKNKSVVVSGDGEALKAGASTAESATKEHDVAAATAAAVAVPPASSKNNDEANTVISAQSVHDDAKTSSTVVSANKPIVAEETVKVDDTVDRNAAAAAYATDENENHRSGGALFFLCALFVALFFGFHYRKKILGLIVEGRSNTRRTGPNVRYRRLSTNESTRQNDNDDEKD